MNIYFFFLCLFAGVCYALDLENCKDVVTTDSCTFKRAFGCQYKAGKTCDWGYETEVWNCVQNGVLVEVECNSICHTFCPDVRVNDCPSIVSEDCTLTKEEQRCSINQGVGYFHQEYSCINTLDVFVCQQKCCCERLSYQLPPEYIPGVKPWPCTNELIYNSTKKDLCITAGYA